MRHVSAVVTDGTAGLLEVDTDGVRAVAQRVGGAARTVDVAAATLAGLRLDAEQVGPDGGLLVAAAAELVLRAGARLDRLGVGLRHDAEALGAAADAYSAADQRLARQLDALGRAGR